MALFTDEQIISLDGDGSLLMNLGTIASIGREKPQNLIVIVWDNEEWGQTGHQSSHTAMGTELEQVAKGCGIPRTATVSSEEQLETILREALNAPGPWFIVAKIEETDHLPYAPIEPEMTLHRFRATFEDAKSNPLTEPWLYKEQSPNPPPPLTLSLSNGRVLPSPSRHILRHSYHPYRHSVKTGIHRNPRPSLRRGDWPVAPTPFMLQSHRQPASPSIIPATPSVIPATLPSFP